MCVQLFLNLGTTQAAAADAQTLARHGCEATRCHTPNRTGEEPAMKNSLAFARQLVEEEDAQDVVEYGLLIATIAISVLPATPPFRHNTALWFTTLPSPLTPPP